MVSDYGTILGLDDFPNEYKAVSIAITKCKAKELLSLRALSNTQKDLSLFKVCQRNSQFTYWCVWLNMQNFANFGKDAFKLTKIWN